MLQSGRRLERTASKQNYDTRQRCNSRYEAGSDFKKNTLAQAQALLYLYMCYLATSYCFQGTG